MFVRPIQQLQDIDQGFDVQNSQHKPDNGRYENMIKSVLIPGQCSVPT